MQSVRPSPQSHCLRLPGTRGGDDEDEEGDGLLPPEGWGLHQQEHAPRAVTAAFLSRGSVAASCNELSSSRKAVAAEEKKSGNAILTVHAAITIPCCRSFVRARTTAAPAADGRARCVGMVGVGTRQLRREIGMHIDSAAQGESRTKDPKKKRAPWCTPAWRSSVNELPGLFDLAAVHQAQR